jgi:hypothetical protein
VLGAALATIARPRRRVGPRIAATEYACPMHPTIVQDHPGDCPICGMAAPAAPAAAVDAGPRRVVGYRSPMDPRQTSPVPRQDEMGMDYLPIYEDETSGGAPVAGLAPVDIDPGRQQLIGLTTAAATRAPIGGQLRVVGRIAIDETRVRHVNVKNAGFVERIFVNYIGQPVRRGDPLFTLFSPDLLAAQEEYLVALKSRATLGGDDGQALATPRAAAWRCGTCRRPSCAASRPAASRSRPSPSARRRPGW